MKPYSPLRQRSPDQYTDDAPGESIARKEYHAQQDGLPQTPGGGKPVGGTDNLRANQQTKQAAQPQTPSGGKRKWPAGVDSYTDGSV